VKQWWIEFRLEVYGDVINVAFMYAYWSFEIFCGAAADCCSKVPIVFTGMSGISFNTPLKSGMPTVLTWNHARSVRRGL